MNNDILRLLIDSPAKPEVNMAADEVLSRSIALRQAAPFARFYRWNPPTLSFGFFQPIDRLVDCAAAEKAGIGIVRRQSGGKMIFHEDEITFSFGMPTQLLYELSGGRSDFMSWFNALLQPLVDALNQAGIPARFAAASEVERGRSNRIHCYSAAAGHSVYIDDKKLIGAAGLVRENVLMLHGSLPIAPSPFPQQLFFNEISLPKMAFLSDFLSRTTIERLPEKIAAGLAAKLNCNVFPSQYEATETQEIIQLSSNKYSFINWNRLSPVEL